jgi:1-acyl-sn-glycerol-3-phosphate acyltransferase
MPQPHDVPHVPGWFQDGFHGFLRPFLARHFHGIGIHRDSLNHADIPEDEPLLIFGNHPSWWDPLIAHFLNRRLFPQRQFYAPIDAEALDQYRVFGKLGFYGVRLNTTSGAAAFLKQSMAILGAPGTAIWLTPEGRFSDVRDHSADLMPGLSHLCSRMQTGQVVPLALEYVFWNERLPVCLARLGEPISIQQNKDLSKPDWNRLVTQRLRDTQTELSHCAMQRSADRFENLIRGKVGAGGFYDFFRRLKSWARLKRFRPQHGNQFE